MSEAFILANTVPGRAPLVPEIVLRLASEITPIWQATEAHLAREGLEPPFWAFAWPGAQALARLVLDDPPVVAGRRVLDFASGCGLAAIACVRAGAQSVEACEIDALAGAAIGMNARENGVAVTVTVGDLVGAARRWDVILCGDVCYEAPMTSHIMPWLRLMAAHGARVLVADPGRAYLPADLRATGPAFNVPTSLELEDRELRQVVVFEVETAESGAEAPVGFEGQGPSPR